MKNNTFSFCICLIIFFTLLFSSCNGEKQDNSEASSSMKESQILDVSSMDDFSSNEISEESYIVSENDDEKSDEGDSISSASSVSTDETIDTTSEEVEKSEESNSESEDLTEESSFEEKSEASSKTEDASNENSQLNENFTEPLGETYTTEKGNVFETNCKDEEILVLMGEIADVASNYNKTTVYYTDVYQKYYFAYGADNVHNTASTIKAPYATYILKSGADLSEKLTMEQRHVFTGSGVLKNMEIGTEFTVSELIRYMITRSDNTAYAMLLERFGTNGFSEYSKSLGIDFKIPSGGYTTCTIREMATFLFDIYKYENTERGKTLIKHMKNCSYSLQIPKAVSYDVAHKFGFIYEGKAFHDMGIVYAPTPYIELIFTKINGTVYDTKAFLEIGKLVDVLHQALSNDN